MRQPALTIFWLAGENSGDKHAALAMRGLNSLLPGVNHVGIGGKLMQEQGLRPLFPFARFNVMGFAEVLRHLPFFLRVERRLKAWFRAQRPDLAILVDYPGLNLRIANIADNERIPVLYYICPQFWAWKHERVFQLRANVRHVACILPFEQELLSIHNISASYVGHPIAEEVRFELDRSGFASFYGLDPAKQWLGFLPGSRDVEIRRMLPVFLQAAAGFDPTCYEILVSKAHTVSHRLFMELLERGGLRHAHVIDGYQYEMMKYAVCLVSTSGTATLEAAYIGTPLAICYKASFLSYLIGKRLVRIKRIGLPNIVLNQDLLPELIQDRMNPDNIYRIVKSWLASPQELRRIKQELLKLKTILGERRVSLEVPRLICTLLGRDA